MIVLGRITKQIERDTGGEIKSGDIMIDDFHLNGHIPQKHSVELCQLGIEPFEYVRYIADSFCEIREGTNNSYLLISPHTSTEIKNIAAITMELINGDGDKVCWLVRTAQPRNIKKLVKRRLVWMKK